MACNGAAEANIILSLSAVPPPADAGQLEEASDNLWFDWKMIRTMLERRREELDNVRLDQEQVSSRLLNDEEKNARRWKARRRS